MAGSAAGSDSGAGQSAAGAGAGTEQSGGAAGAAGAGSAIGGASSGAGGDSSSGGDVSQVAGAAGTGEVGAGGSPATCDALEEEHELAVGVHVATCSGVLYDTNPPSSGPHYPVWADFGVYDFPLPRGFWVHNLEHGAVVVTYNCPDGCEDEVSEASAWLAELVPDASCSAGPPRVLIVPDPELDVRWAASSWGFTLRADCFDAAAFSAFYVAHVGQPIAPEGFLCSTGTDLRAPGAETCGVH